MTPIIESDIELNFDLENNIKVKKFSHVISGKLATYLENLINGLNYFKKSGIEVDEIYYIRVYHFSKEILDNIYIDNFRTFDKAVVAIKLATHSLEISLKHNDFEAILIGFYDLKEDLENLQIITKDDF